MHTLSWSWSWFGTEDLQNWITDLDGFSKAGLALPFCNVPGQGGAAIHYGFYIAYLSVQLQIHIGTSPHPDTVVREGRQGGSTGMWGLEPTRDTSRHAIVSPFFAALSPCHAPAANPMLSPILPGKNRRARYNLIKKKSKKKRALFAALQNAMQQYPGYPVVVTGHSLGAALSTLAALDLACTAWNNPANPMSHPPISPVVVYNYGSPRLGNQAFANTVNDLVATPVRGHFPAPTPARRLACVHVKAFTRSVGAAPPLRAGSRVPLETAPPMPPFETAISFGRGFAEGDAIPARALEGHHTTPAPGRDSR